MAPRGKKAAAKATKAVEPEEAPVEAPSEPIVLHVTGLQRPWQDSELKEKLSSAAGKEILEYRVNDIRSEAFVTGPLFVVKQAWRALLTLQISACAWNNVMAFCLLKFPDIETADAVIAEVHGKTLNDKPGAKNLTVKVYDPNAVPAEPEPSTEVSTTDSTDNTNKELSTKEQRHLERLASAKVTVAEPQLTYIFRPKDLVEHIRRRRGYELDSSALARRIPGRGKRRHSEIKSVAIASTGGSETMATDE